MLDPKGIVIRAMYLKYDHFSDNCDTYHKPDMTDEFDKGNPLETILFHGISLIF